MKIMLGILIVYSIGITFALCILWSDLKNFKNFMHDEMKQMFKWWEIQGTIDRQIAINMKLWQESEESDDSMDIPV